MNLKISRMQISDLDSIHDILVSEFDDFWTPSIFKEELQNSNSLYFMAQIDDEIVGFAGIKIILDEADLMNIVVKKSYRNKGIGKSLLNYIISNSKDLDLQSITLEVNENNSVAIHLYESLGFQKVGFRKNYYKNDNGLLMTKQIQK